MSNQRDPACDYIAAVELMAASKHLGQSTDVMCAGMLIALVEVARHMDPEQRTDLAMTLYATADQVGAPIPDWAPKP